MISSEERRRYTQAEAEAALQVSETRFRMLFEQAAVGMAQIDIHRGRFLRVSRRFSDIIGYTSEELLTLSFQAITHPDDLDADLQQMERLSAGEIHEFAAEKRYICKNGRIIRVLVTISPMWAPGESPDNVIAIIEDITERKQIEAERERFYVQERAARAQAEEASGLKDEFLAMVSHELRTPLTAFLGYAYLLQANKHNEAYVARTIEKMLQSAKAQAQLIENLIDMARVVSGKLRLDIRPTDMVAVVHAALATARPAITAKQLQLSIRLPSSTCIVLGDGNRLQQVAWNLISNAAKFTPPGGNIEIRLEQHDRNVELIVSDTGQGIRPDVLPYIFDRFRQAESTGSRLSSGLGLGLAIVRRVVELHGGMVAASSAGVGQGASFTVRLPSAATEESTAQPGTRAIYAAGLGGVRILLVDDQRETRTMLEEILTPYGAVVLSCTSAHDVLALVQAWHPDMLIADCTLPDEDALRLIRRVRALPREQGGAVAAIALTSVVRIEDRLRILAAGFEQYVPRPIDPAEFLDVVALLASASRKAPENDQ